MTTAVRFPSEASGAIILPDCDIPAGGHPPGTSHEEVYGLLRLAGIDVALPLDVLREVVHCPMELAPLPSDVSGLLGAMNLRNTVLPVIDLRAVLARGGERSADQVVVVVACNGQLIGVLADEVRGVTRLRGDALLPVAAASRRLLFSHTFQHPDDGTVFSVLDAGAMLRETGVPTVADTIRSSTLLAGAGSSATEGGGGASSASDVRKLTLVRCGDHRLALDVAHVHTILPPPDVRPSVLDSALCIGVTDYAGREVPVVDPLTLLGLGRMSVDQVGAGLVLELGHGFVVLALTALQDLLVIRGSDVLPLSGLSVPGRRLLSAVVDVAGTGPWLIADGPALAAVPELVSLASVNTALDGVPLLDFRATVSAGSAGSAGIGEAYLTYSAGADIATPLHQVVEILPFPSAITTTPGADGVLGIVVHREAAVPVLRLAEMLGRTGEPIGVSTCLLLVAVDGEIVAFAVDRLRGIEPLSWCDPDHVLLPDAPRNRLLNAARLVQVGTNARMLPEVNLTTLALSLRKDAGLPG